MSATNKTKSWQLGNTSVRSPFRLRDGLIALSASPLQGDLRGKEQEEAWRNLLGEAKIVALGTDKTFSVGRKWRSALEKLGFLYPEVPKGLNQNELGQLDTITPNGWRLIRADTVPAMQECFLRALAAYHTPSPQEKKYQFAPFSPLKHTLRVMLALDEKVNDTKLTLNEMALIVQVSTSANSISAIVEKIIDLRQRKEGSGNKRKFESAERKAAAENLGLEDATLTDYADLNFRYLKATGLFLTKGKGIALAPEKYVFIQRLVQDENIPTFDLDYYRALCEGARLPTDDKDSALIVLHDLAAQLKKRGIQYDLSSKDLTTPHDIGIVRHALEELISHDNEAKFAKDQATKLDEITAYIDLILSQRDKKVLSDGETIEVPKSERPAYLEWILWRSFLAINQLQNKPYESRRFKIDQDFLPVSCAPGGGPDMVFEFDELTLVVEVTLTSSSRQEAAEGEPVRRHVAAYAEKSTKPVFGLFVAISIDSNTAHTFRFGDWYLADDSKKSLDIVPITLLDFRNFLIAGTKKLNEMPNRLRQLLIECRAKANQEAPQWKNSISAIVKQSNEKMKV
ncbi:MAG: AlwI family type II restriction endonuclease [bacterium]|nr:AlwI family type II restriction endonuclease [bacterium]